jgi:phosphate:Na+ symporter
MTLATINGLVGGLGLFLLGMWLMTEGLKLTAGEALETILERWTRTPVRAFGSGFLITGVVQSSSATTVATVGFVNAGLMGLQQAVWVIIGSNGGTTMTSWLVALVGIKVDVGAFAMLLLGGGMMLRLLAGSSLRRAGAGQAIAGFGAFFLGISALQGAFTEITPQLSNLAPEGDGAGVLATLGFIGLGAALTVLTQSSSAAMAIALTASATGSIPLTLAAATVIGVNIGTTSTAIFAALNATAPARRVALAHVLFNAWTALIALALLPVLLAVSRLVAQTIDGGGAMATVLAVFHTLFNLLGAMAIWPLRTRFVGWLERRFIALAEQPRGLAHLDATLLQVPAIAMRGLAMELGRLLPEGFAEVRGVISRSRITLASPPLNAATLLRHSQQVRQFIARLGADRLPDDMAASLPAMIRATQHLDEALIAIDPLSKPLPSDDSPNHQAMRKLEQAALECLDLGEPGALTLRHPALLEEQARRLDSAYEDEKAHLLSATVTGALPVGEMEVLIDRARLLRQCGLQAIKAQRRLNSLGDLLAPQQ